MADRPSASMAVVRGTIIKSEAHNVIDKLNMHFKNTFQRIKASTAYRFLGLDKISDPGRL